MMLKWNLMDLGCLNNVKMELCGLSCLNDVKMK